MPELPDLTIYMEALQVRVQGKRLESVRVLNPFFLRTADPPLSDAAPATVRELRRIGKRIALGLDNDLWLVTHLMIAGRLHWRAPGATLSGRRLLAGLIFPEGILTVTEAGSKRRASLHVVRGASGLARLDPGGLEPLNANLREFSARLSASNHTLKRALTSPAIISGIGNAYSDEILHRARLSPVALTQSLSEAQTRRLFDATRETLELWTARLREIAAGKFPEKVTAFREGMAVHGRFGQPCPVCQAPVQRIRYVEREVNYCARCQTRGRVLKDRALSRLLKADWPGSIEQWEWGPASLASPQARQNRGD